MAKKSLFNSFREYAGRTRNALAVSTLAIGMGYASQAYADPASINPAKSSVKPSLINTNNPANPAEKDIKNLESKTKYLGCSAEIQVGSGNSGISIDTILDTKYAYLKPEISSDRAGMSILDKDVRTKIELLANASAKVSYEGDSQFSLGVKKIADNGRAYGLSAWAGQFNGLNLEANLPLNKLTKSNKLSAKLIAGTYFGDENGIYGGLKVSRPVVILNKKLNIGFSAVMDSDSHYLCGFGIGVLPSTSSVFDPMRLGIGVKERKIIVDDDDNGDDNGDGNGDNNDGNNGNSVTPPQPPQPPQPPLPPNPNPSDWNWGTDQGPVGAKVKRLR